MALVAADGVTPLKSAPVPRAPDPRGSAVTNRRGMRAALNGGMTAYDAADYGSQEMASWHPWLGSPDTEGNPYRDRIVARIRDVVRNDGWASGLITRMLDSVVGGHLRLVVKPDFRALQRYAKAFDATWASEFGSYVSSSWRSWGYDVNRWCDVSRRLTFSGMSRLAFRHKLIDGDALSYNHWKPENVGPGRASYATAIQILDPDRLSNPYLVPDQPHLRGGVEINDDGAAVAYHIRRAHQADWFVPTEAYTWERIPRETVWGRPIIVHDFDADRAAQHRSAGGILKPVLGRLRMLARYDSVELQAAVVNAIFAAYIESPFDHELLADALHGEDGDKELKSYQDQRADFHDRRNLTLQGARIPTLFPGEKMISVAANRPSQGFAEFEAAMLRNVAAAGGISEAQVSQDWSRTNYSSARAALLEAWKSLGRQRLDFANGWATPTYGAWLEEEMDRGEVPLPVGAPDFIEARTAYMGCRWMGPGRGWIDPVKEAQAAVLRMDAGVSTLEMECAEQGLDWEEVLDQRAIEILRMEELGLEKPDWAGGQPAQQDSSRPQPE